jgi:hypothetical protein
VGVGSDRYAAGKKRSNPTANSLSLNADSELFLKIAPSRITLGLPRKAKHHFCMITGNMAQMIEAESIDDKLIFMSFFYSYMYIIVLHFKHRGSLRCVLGQGLQLQ